LLKTKPGGSIRFVLETVGFLLSFPALFDFSTISPPLLQFPLSNILKKASKDYGILFFLKKKKKLKFNLELS
jgi:hypothetical protein